MIFAHINNSDLTHYPHAITLALDWIRRHDTARLPAGRYQDEVTGWQVQVLDLETADRTHYYPEAHRHHIDVQYLVHGDEWIGVATEAADLKVQVPWERVRDIIFYQEVAHESRLHMQPGHFAVFFPQDIHCPNCAPHAPATICKVVVKIPVADFTTRGPSQ